MVYKDNVELKHLCPYCFSETRSTSAYFFVWPRSEPCTICGKYFGRDRYGRTIKFSDCVAKRLIFVLCTGCMLYLFLKS